MGVRDWIRRVLAWLFPPRSPPPSPQPAQSASYPTEWSTSVFEAPEVHVAIYSLTGLIDQNERVPEIVAGRYLANALEDLGVNYRIKRGYPPVDLEDRETLLGRWVRAEKPWEAKDANVLLTDHRGGGLSFVGGRFGYAPGGHIDEVVEWQPTGDTLLHRNVHAILHEVGHMLGAHHDHDRTQDGMQHPGMGWNEAGHWHRTPTVAGNGYPNLCGDPVDAKRHDRVIRHQLYHDCFREHLEIAPLADRAAT